GHDGAGGAGRRVVRRRARQRAPLRGRSRGFSRRTPGVVGTPGAGLPEAGRRGQPRGGGGGEGAVTVWPRPAFRRDGIEVIALLGAAGTGKSHRALLVARSMDIPAVIDDGLLIEGGKIRAGRSAKEAKTRIEAVRLAI